MGRPSPSSRCRCRKVPRQRFAPTRATGESSAQARWGKRARLRSGIPLGTRLCRGRPRCRRQFSFRRCRRHQSRFSSAGLLGQQAILVFDYEGTEAKGITIHARETRQALGCELRRDDVDEELPLGRNRRKLEYQISRVARKMLADQHDARAELPEIPRDGQILLTRLRAVDPHAETKILGDHFLRAMAEASRAHRGCRRFHAFFPKQPRFAATPEAGTASQEIRNSAGKKPGCVCNLFLPAWNGARGFGNRKRERGRELRIERTGDIACEKTRGSGQGGVGVDGNGVIERDGNDDGNLRFLGQRPVRRIRHGNDGRAGRARFCSELNDFDAAAAARNNDDGGTGREGGEQEQLRRVLHVDRTSILVKERAHIECRMPTAADPGQVDVPRVADCGSRRTQSRESRPAQVFDGPLQFVRLAENVAQKMCHMKSNQLFQHAGSDIVWILSPGKIVAFAIPQYPASTYPTTLSVCSLLLASINSKLM